MRPQEHLSEASRIAAAAEAKSREPNQQPGFDIAPWLKAHVHATIALAASVEGLREVMTAPRKWVVPEPRWQTAVAAPGADEFYSLPRDGWEPFAVTPDSHVWFRRPREAE